MKILLTTGGSGGHFYPMIAVAEQLNQLAIKEKIVDFELFYVSDSPYDKRALDDNRITFYKLPTGKRRTYASILNFFDIFKTAIAVVRAIFLVYKIFPDVIFSKGGYAAVPVTIAARILDIPLVIHESDSVPGRANKMAGKWATRIAISYKEAIDHFPKEKTAFVGPIVRREVREPLRDGAQEYLKLASHLPVIFVIGGSQGAKIINETILNALPELVKRYQIIHQTGTAHFENIKDLADIVLENSEGKSNYYPYPYLNKLAIRMAAGVSSLVISRAGAGAIGEISCWGLPSIIIPITNSNGDHQRMNAFNYARAGACTVVEEANLAPHVLVAEIDRIMSDAALQASMKEATKMFVYPDAELKVAEEIVNIALTHES